jgi:tetratricopeptide (TPR) repeat protein
MLLIQKKNYAVAGPKFREVYNLLNAAGQDNKLYLYYSGLSYAQADKKTEAIEAYNILIDSGYTGSETTYTAKNKKTGQVENLDKTSWELSKKLGDAADFTMFKTEVTPSREAEFYETNPTLLLDAGRNDEALTLIQKGIKKFPNNGRLGELQGNAYLKAAKMDDFVVNLKAQISKNPNDAINYYNLGVMLSKDPAKNSEAVEAFKKSVELKPDYADAWRNLDYVTMGDDGKAIEDYNAAKKAKKPELADKIINDRRARLAAALPHAEKWYQAAKNDVKFAEFKAKEEAMEANQK